MKLLIYLLLFWVSILFFFIVYETFCLLVLEVLLSQCACFFLSFRRVVSLWMVGVLVYSLGNVFVSIRLGRRGAKWHRLVTPS